MSNAPRPAASSTMAMSFVGFSSRTATAGAIVRTMTPVTSGSRVIMTTIFAIAAGGICNGLAE